MRLKLDENLGPTVQRVFENAGHDVETALSERLSGADDRQIFMACCRENRSLVTLDLDFADPLHFHPHNCGGIVVLRARGQLSLSLLQSLARETVSVLKRMPLDGKLWVVEPGRIRVHQSDND